MKNIAKMDTEELHLESLQLRNQQFILGSIALTGSGLSAWLLPGIAAAANGSVSELALVTATLCWILMLFVLFRWTLALRQMIRIISEYLRCREESAWEGHFDCFRERNPHLYTSQ